MLMTMIIMIMLYLSDNIWTLIEQREIYDTGRVAFWRAVFKFGNFPKNWFNVEVSWYLLERTRHGRSVALILLAKDAFFLFSGQVVAHSILFDVLPTLVLRTHPAELLKRPKVFLSLPLFFEGHDRSKQRSAYCDVEHYATHNQNGASPRVMFDQKLNEKRKHEASYARSCHSNSCE